MQVEISVALNFLISFLYNKLPRRRVNQFGEELEAALKLKFEGHWYADKPFKGSAFRCLKTSPPLDPVFELAAREAGMDLSDIQENLPAELSIWIDPGEVSYRMSEKGPVKILYTSSDHQGLQCSEHGDREVTRTFNPEAQCFKPLDNLSSQFGGLSMNEPPPPQHSPLMPPQHSPNGSLFGGLTNNGFKGPNHNLSPSILFPKSSPSQSAVMTTAAFAATKFGSTKLKTNTKRSQRMSPTEFSNYIKQRALLQQQQQQSQMCPPQPPAHLHQPRLSGDGPMLFGHHLNSSPQNSRSISPEQGPHCPLDNSFMPMQSSSSGSSLASSVSSTGSLFGGASAQASFLPSPTSRSPPFASAFDNGFCLNDLLGGLHQPSTATDKFGLPPLHQQLDNTGKTGSNLTARLNSFMDQAGPFGGQAMPQQQQQPIGSSGSSIGLIGQQQPPPQLSPIGGQSQLGDLQQQRPGGQGTSVTGQNESKGFDNLNLSNGMTYQNQYQHLLLTAN